MKVLMVAPYDTKGRYAGGIYSIVRAIVSNEHLLQDHGMDLTIFNTCRVERKIGKDGGVDLSNIKNFLSIKKDIIPEIKRTNPDVIYYHSSVKLALFKDLLIIRKIKKKTKKKIILHIHFADIEKILMNRKVFDNISLNVMKKYIDRVVFLSTKTAESFVASGLDVSKTSVIYNFSTIDFSAQEIERKLNRDSAPLNFLFVGSIDRRKGIFDLLKVLSSLDFDYQLTVCGNYFSQAEEQEMKKYKNKLGEQLVLKGYISGEEKKKAYYDADVLALPSYGEGLPMVIVEAFTAGCGVLSTTVGAIPEIVTSNGGILVAPGDESALKEAILNILEVPDLAKSFMKYNASISNEYSISKFIRNVAKACEEAT